MFAEARKSILSLHLKKTGGTSLNAWLDCLAEDGRAWGQVACPDLGGVFSGNAEHTGDGRDSYSAAAASIPYLSRSIHSHMPVTAARRPGTFALTILRDPARRVLSQIGDWRRLGAHDRARAVPSIREAMLDAVSMDATGFLQRHGRGAPRFLFDNYMTRAVAAGRLGIEAVAEPDAGKLLPVALRSLEQDYDFVGTTENLSACRLALASSLGLPPPGDIPELNVSGLGRGAPPDGVVPQNLIEHDTKLFDCARYLMAARIGNAAPYDTAVFEDRHAAAVVEEMDGVWVDGAVAFSVRRPMFADGIHGRDAAGRDDCAVWTGPGRVATFYLPAPPSLSLEFMVWIRGYATEAHRENLSISVDGITLPIRFEQGSSCREIAVAHALTRDRPFARLQISGLPATPHGEPGSAGHDPRKRAVCLDRYGWRLAA